MSERLARLVRQQAEACDVLGSPLYGDLMRRAADDVLDGGVVATVLAGHEDDPGPSAVTLRLFGAVHRLVLAGRVPELARYYPSAGGVADAARAWPALRRVLVEHTAEIRGQLEQAPQTNEVGRAAALMGGLLHVAAATGLPVRLYEIGASAGLNLRADHFRYSFDGGPGWGPQDSPVALRNAWTGVLPPLGADLRVVERRGCDLHPVDPAGPDAWLRLASYLWPDQTDRFARLRGALEIARQIPAELVRLPAGQFVAQVVPVTGSVVVLWHSVMWQYLGRDEKARIDDELGRLAAESGRDAPVAHLAFEPRRTGLDGRWAFLVTLTLWPGGRERVLGEAPPHGVPTDWR
jgi:hypothetical protein